jgi:hypothetical protein
MGPFRCGGDALNVIWFSVEILNLADELTYSRRANTNLPVDHRPTGQSIERLIIPQFV